MNTRFTSEGPGAGRANIWGAVLIGALLLALVGFTAGAIHGHTDASSSGRPSMTSGLTGSSSTNDGVADPHLGRCRQVYDDQLAPLLAATTAMPQWQIHIGAMNQLVLGVITLKQATQFWSRTRVGVHHRLRAFHEAMARYRQRSVHCRPLGASPGRRLTRCAQSVAARNQVLRAARRALGTWSAHVMHMEMLRAGTMSPATATRLWLQNWHQGQREIGRYRVALREARADPAPC